MFKMLKKTRRDALRDAALIGTGFAAFGSKESNAAVGAGPITGSGSRWDAEYDFGHRILFMDEYLNSTFSILGSLSGEVAQIDALADRAVHSIKNGGTVYSTAGIGHMPYIEQRVERRGNPAVIKDHRVMQEKKNKAEMRELDCSAMKKGDFHITNYCNRSVQEARDRGVYTVSVPVNYVNSEFWPKDYVYPNEDDLLLGDVSNEVLHSHIPHEQGLVHPPEIPWMAICPSCVTALGAIHWMLSAEIANKLADKKAKPFEKSTEYLAILKERLEKVGKEHRDRIREAAVEMTHRVRSGGRWFVQSIEHTGFRSELVRVASGPWMPNTGDWNANPFRNVMLITGMSPAFPEEVAAAVKAQVEGAFVIGIGPSSMDGVVPSGCLIDVADAGFDNFSPESGGVLELPDRDGKWCPTSGIVGNVIQQMICAQWADEMARRGSIPYFLLGNYRGGRPFNRMIKPFAEARGY